MQQLSSNYSYVKVIIPPKFTHASSFKNNRADVSKRIFFEKIKMGKKYRRMLYSEDSGVIDSKGKWVVKSKYDWVQIFDDGTIKTTSFIAPAEPTNKKIQWFDIAGNPITIIEEPEV